MAGRETAPVRFYGIMKPRRIALYHNERHGSAPLITEILNDIPDYLPTVPPIS